MASTTWSESLSAVGKSSVNGMLRFLSWVERRCKSISSVMAKASTKCFQESRYSYLVKVILALFGIVNCGFVSVMP